jgi:hypothetical protein
MQVALAVQLSVSHLFALMLFAQFTPLLNLCHVIFCFIFGLAVHLEAAKSI